MKKNLFKLLILMILAVSALSLVSCSQRNDGDSSIEEIKGTDGLEYFPLDNGTYAVGVGTATMVSDITIPNYYNGKKVTVICEDAFRDCENLKYISIPDTIETIDSLAFYKCENLKSITLGKGIKSIKHSAFEECESLVSVKFSGDIEKWCNIEFENCFANPIHRASLYINNTLLTNLVIPITVRSIGDYAFYNYKNLTSVNIELPTNLMTIGDCAFAYCDNLTSIIIPKSVTEVGESVFYGCNDFTIYCMAESKPRYWNDNWNHSECPVVWGYTGE